MNDLVLKYGMPTLKTILKNGNKARYKQILEEFPATSGTLSRVLKALEEEGLIERIVDSNLRPPVSYYSVTERGREWIKEDTKTMALLVFDHKEIEDLIEKLRKLIEKK
jgi:DNA-binding HxlR family transcriptional regulator